MCSQFINEVPSDIFSDLKQIGSGSFSIILSANHVKTNTLVALKVSLKTDENFKPELAHQELIVHKSLNHPLICKYYTDFETEHLMISVMELVEGINLLEYVNKKSNLGMQEIKKIFAQIIIVIEYLHEEHNIAHRDLKLENIMLDNYGNIRLIDFGFSSQKRIMSTLCGSIPYCAPEVLQCDYYTKKADIWCLGIILYSLAFRHLPFYDTNMRKLANIICNDEPVYPSVVDSDLQDLLFKLLMKDPCQRISIEDIKHHNFMSHVRILQINYKQLFSLDQLDQNIFKKKSESKIRVTQSHPNIKKSPIISSSQRNSHFCLPQLSTKNGHSQIADLHKNVTMAGDNLDDLILNRKNFSKNLNKLIESAYLIDSHNCISTCSSRIRFETAKTVRFNFPNVIVRRNSHSQKMFSQFPQIARPI